MGFNKSINNVWEEKHIFLTWKTSRGTTKQVYPTAENTFPRRCSGIMSGDLSSMIANITAYNTPINATHITIHTGIKTIWKLSEAEKKFYFDLDYNYF